MAMIARDLLRNDQLDSYMYLSPYMILSGQGI